ncbi:hypothetical protein [Parvularcula sp. LCG005]|uniref:hypothetical protein n=1 Tax=Parvularcula sp. LCG005 TaxID=3078805 RepID=UPI002943C5D1|nr:hypothetical protein [Parvularcula sp. LCG005]WOI52951.1 hypothetical protein RUI03_12415 [Parvularcula sp. LCG005]
MSIQPIHYLQSPDRQSGADPVAAAAEDLAITFMGEMLKASGLTKALGAEGAMASAFSSTIITQIAENVVTGSPDLAHSLYRQLSGPQGEATS